MQIKISKIKYIILNLLLQVSLAFSVHAADMSAIDFNGNLLGKVIPDGSVVNFDNELIGKITADGYAINEENTLIGGIVPLGIAISVNNQVLGKVNNDGSVTSANNDILGKVLPNSLVVNDNYDILGAVIAPGLVYDDRGKIVGRVSGDGNFYNLSGDKTGYVTATGYVFAPTGTESQITLIGRLLSSKMVIDASGKFLGSIAPDGKVVDLNKNIIGNIHANGFAYNADSAIVGHIVENGYAFSFDGSYLGFISYNGEVVNQGQVLGFAVLGNRVIGKDNSLLGFSVSQSATANTLDGKYLGRLVANGNIVKAREIVGKIGASGNIIDNKGNIIGVLNEVGPVFDYLGKIRGHASVDGKIVSLDGAQLGYIYKERALDRNDKEFARIQNNRLCFDNNNKFIGVNGISSTLAMDGKVYTISPYGYVFNEKGEISGRNLIFSNIISGDGKILAYMSSLGESDNKSLNEIAKLTGSGWFLDKNNELIGKAVTTDYATDFYGNTIGYTNPSNLIIDNQNIISAKILPNNKIISLSGGVEKGMAGDASLSISINGDYLGTNLINGEIKKAGEIIGKISSDNYVVDNLGALYGTTLSFGVAVSSNCKFLGVVSDNGDIKNFSGVYVGSVLPNNQIINETQTVIGHVINPHAVTGEGGEVLGVENALGTVLNYDNRNLGCQGIDGNIRNSQNEIIGQMITNASVMGYNNQVMGEIDFSGKVMDSAQRVVGYIGIDGGVHSVNGNDIGVVFGYTVAFDNNNTYLGRVNPQGEVLSDKGEVLGKVNYNGEVVLKNGETGFALYDLYVYDNDEKTIGYIAKNGTVYSIMGDVRGKIHQGFVLDKRQNLIGRGKRDYYIRDENKNIIGYLTLNGKVINYKNITVGELNENGDVINSSGTVIATAESLQYYHKQQNLAKTSEPTVLEPATPSENISDNEVTKNPDIIPEDTLTKGNNETTVSENIQKVNDVMANHKIVGIAVTPGGKYIGDVYSNNEVIDSNGNIIGNRNKDGQIVDENGNILGGFQIKADEQNKAADRNWWKNIMDGVTASPYNTNNEAVNVGPGGGIGPGGRYNPRRAEILAQLQNSRRQSMSGKSITNNLDISGYSGWQDSWDGVVRSISSLRVDMSNMITADKPIPAVLARSLISLGNAPITAIVERNVYGEMGRNVIIPAGSRIIGGLNDGEGIDVASRFDGTSGGVKMKISWQRIIRPDGISFILDTESQTGDAQGRGGGALGYIDEQMVKKYTMPILGTLATSAISYMMAADQDATGEVETSQQQAASDARQQFLEKMNDILDEIIESKSQIEPVTFVPAGTRIIIYPMTDLWLRSTKEIERGEKSTANKGYKDVLIDDTNQSTTVETNNNANVNGPRGQNNQGTQPQNAPLIGDGNQQQQSSVPGAIPPPAADGTVAQFPDDDENETGDIELF